MKSKQMDTESKDVPQPFPCIQNNIIKDSIGKVDIYKCQKCPFMSFSANDMKYHQLSTHMSLDVATAKEKTVKLLSCPGCNDQYFTESFLKIHLFSFHQMALKEISKLTVLLKKNQKPNESQLQNIETVVNETAYNNLSMRHTGEMAESSNPLPEEDTTAADECKTPDLHQINIKPPTPINKINNEIEIVKTSYDENVSFNESEDLSYDKLSNIYIIHDINANNFTLQDKAICEVRTVDNCITEEISLNIPDRENPEDLVLFKSNSGPTNIMEPLIVCPKVLPVCKTKHSKTGRPSGARSFSINKKVGSEDKSVSEKFAFKCNMQDCGVRLELQENMFYHNSCHLNNTKELFCPECKQFFVTVEKLHNHLWKIHNIDIELNSCNECSYKVYSLTRLNNIHKKIHSPEKNYKCEVCSKAFKNTKQLANHSMIHKRKIDGSKKFICTICKRELRSRTLLQAHMKNIHEKTKLFYCKHCQYSSTMRSSLILHMRSHTGEKPYQCMECSFRTTDKCTLRRHIMRHFQQKNYKCEYCSYSCIQASSIKSHIKVKHPGKKTDLLNSCPYCLYTSVNKSNYLNHLFTHKNEKKSDNTKDDISENKNSNEDLETLNLNMTNDKTECLEFPNIHSNIIEPKTISNTVDNTCIEINHSDIENQTESIKSISMEIDQQHNNIQILKTETRNLNSKDGPQTIFLKNGNNNISSIKPRKSKISVKSNLILKGPNNLQSFDTYSSFNDFRHENECLRSNDLFLGSHEIALSNSYPILTNLSNSNVKSIVDFDQSNIDSDVLNENNLSFDSSSLDGKDTSLVSPYCLLNKQLDDNSRHFNNDTFLPPMMTDVKGKINLNTVHYFETETDISSKDSYKIHIEESFKFENKTDSLDGNLNPIESFDDSYVYLTNSSLPVMEGFTSPFYNLNEMDSNKYMNDNIMEEELSMNVSNVINNTIVIDETSCDMKSFVHLK